MARKLRIEYPGAIYHVVNRGDHKEPIFKDDTDRYNFLIALEEVCGKTDWEVHSYCLMRNHFHLVIETPKANLVAGMKWLLGTYTGRFNRRHQKIGHLFAGRYKALVVDGSGNGYLRTVCEYVHLNPVRARLIRKDQPLTTYSWSSFPSYLESPRRRPAWLRVDRVFGESGIGRDTKTARNSFERLVENRRGDTRNESYGVIRRDWCWGDQTFRKELLGQIAERMGVNHYGSERREMHEDKAERIIEQESKRLGLIDSNLAKMSKSHPKKILLALRLREETTMSVAWVAERLSMGSRNYATKLLHAERRQRSGKRLAGKIRN